METATAELTASSGAGAAEESMEGGRQAKANKRRRVAALPQPEPRVTKVHFLVFLESAEPGKSPVSCICGPFFLLDLFFRLQTEFLFRSKSCCPGKQIIRPPIFSE